ncbi:hypothetical protein [Clostridium butyricum]|uniref:hypothetical protein n=1 Tax=Clostridium butyricum TaxID=1492 RepID=UPI000903636F|nr:hypothetical protein [Clostridium butyricum]APF20997.1 hypothetical protein NPD4_3519 [Clostridium butyricum]
MKPILFNTAMVNAILDGRKTTTRRIAKRLKDATKETHGDFKWDYKQACMNDLGLEIVAPFHIGEILYIRETWFEGDILDSNEDIAERNIVLYRTDDLEKHDIEEIKWRPSIHMPKRLARIFLKITGIRVERLKRIEAGQCKAEGIDLGYKIENSFDAGEYCKAFGELWDSTVNKKDIDKYSWNANPYVWVIEFERCEKPND